MANFIYPSALHKISFMMAQEWRRMLSTYTRSIQLAFDKRFKMRMPLSFPSNNISIMKVIQKYVKLEYQTGEIFAFNDATNLNFAEMYWYVCTNNL